jgi:chromate transporter
MAPIAATSLEAEPQKVSLRELCLYFVNLGAFGFGGPIALAGYMQRDLQEKRGWITKDEYQDGLAIAQTMPGPLAAQLAMWIGYIRYGAVGASLVGILFVLPPFVLVTATAAVYVQFEGLPQIRALFYGIGPAAIAIVALSAWRLAKQTDGKDVKLWLTTAALIAITVVTRAELAWIFVVCGLLAVAVYAPPWRTKPEAAAPLAGAAALPGLKLSGLALAGATPGVLGILMLFFLKAAAFTFGSGLAIVPFLHEGVVDTYHWLDERQFLDAVAMGIITPGPVVIMATFVGYLVAGLAGACLASFAVFFPVWVFNVIIGRYFLRHRQNLQVRAFVKGATAAAVGAIAGAAVILGQGAILDVVTGAVFVTSLVVLYFKKLKEPYVIGLAAVVGLVAASVHPL